MKLSFAVVMLMTTLSFAAAPATPATPATQPAPQGMVYIPAGRFTMGGDDPRTPDAQPLHPVSLDAFFIDAKPVTNAEFKKFIDATKYLTVAERKPDPKDYPGVPADKLLAGSAVFNPPPHDVPLDNAYAWWKYEPGASWQHPEGPQSNIEGKDNFPVVHICYEDALAYAKWAGKRLPTEAEYEYAARGGLEGKKYSWGDELTTKDGKYPQNIWTGHFPAENTGADGYKGLSPVDAFPPNKYGLYDIGGNVWSWCSDWYRPDYYQTLDTKTPTKNPQGPPDSFDPAENIPKRVLRGGSFLCAERYCTRYLVGSRGKGAPDSAAINIGLRCVKTAQ